MNNVGNATGKIRYASTLTLQPTNSATAAEVSVPIPLVVVQPTASLATEVEQPAAESSLTPTAEGPSLGSETPQPQPQAPTQTIDFMQLFSSGNLLCFGSTIVELAIVILLVVFLCKK